MYHTQSANGGKRQDLIRFLDKNENAPRLMSIGNLTKDPALKDVNYLVHGFPEKTEYLIKNSFWLAIHTPLTKNADERTAPGLRNCFLKLKAS